MTHDPPRLPHVLAFAFALVAMAAHAQKKSNGDDETLRYSRQMIEQGRQIFQDLVEYLKSL